MKQTQKHKILKLLWDGKWHSVNEINHGLYISQYNARIKELRDAGFDIKNSTFAGMGFVGRPGDVILVPDGYSVHNIPGDLTFFKLITPTNLIDYESLTVKKGQGALNV